MSPLQWRNLNLFALIVTVLVNVLSDLIPFNGKTTGEISSLFPIMITPAPYTFSIWAFIYILLFVFTLYPLFSKKPEARVSIGPLFVLSCLFNMLWVVLWHYLYVQPLLSLLAMIGLLISLLLIYIRVTTIHRPSTSEKLWLQLPFRVYLGWISIATIVNINVVLFDSGWQGFGYSVSSDLWTIFMLAAGTLLAWIVGGICRDYAFVLVFVWAYIGIAVANHSIPSIFYTALILAALMFLYTTSIAFRPRLRVT